MSLSHNLDLVNSNTPRGVDLDGNSVTPGSFIADSVELTNSRGETKDIFNLVTDMVIIEELYSPVIVVKLTIRDNVDFFNSFSISGFEGLKIQLTKTDGEGPVRTTSISLDLIVKEYPNFEKTTESINVQAYDIVAVSKHAGVSKLKKISRAVRGSPTDNIRDVFRRDLNVDDFDTELDLYSCITNFRGIITTMSPLKAVEFLRKKAFDEENTPFFVFTTVRESKIIISSWGSIIKGGIYPADNKPYVWKPYMAEAPGSESYIADMMSKIISLKSNIKLDRLQQASEGGMGSTVNTIDFANKAYTESKFYPSDDPGIVLDKISNGGSNNWEWIMSDITDQDIVAGSETTVMLPPPQYSNGAPSASVVDRNTILRGRYYNANKNTATHDMTVYGDFNLNPGRKIRIRVPAANDPDNTEDSDEFDENLSGTYVVSVAMHTFTDGVYTTRLRLIKDR